MIYETRTSHSQNSLHPAISWRSGANHSGIPRWPSAEFHRGGTPAVDQGQVLAPRGPVPRARGRLRRHRGQAAGPAPAPWGLGGGPRPLGGGPAGLRPAGRGRR